MVGSDIKSLVLGIRITWTGIDGEIREVAEL